MSDTASQLEGATRALTRPLAPEGYGHHADGSPLGTTRRPRCRHCNRVLAEYVTAPWKIKCPKCRAWTGEG